MIINNTYRQTHDNGGGPIFVRLKFRKYHKQRFGGCHTSNGDEIINMERNAFRQFCSVSHLWMILQE